MPVEMIPVLSKDQITKKVQDLADRISEDYAGKELAAIGVLKGAFIFLADLVRALSIPVQIDFVGLSSYGSGTASSGQVRITKQIQLDIAGRDVLIVEDIIDSGLTIAYLLDNIRVFDPSSVRVCAFIDKPERREVQINIDYVAHTVERGFLVGYGLDYDEEYRYLPGIYHLKL